MNPNGEFESNYVLRRLRVELGFEEHSAHRMIHSWWGEIETLQDIRFVQRRRGWTGKGIEASPRVAAVSDGRRLSARRHGPVYREGLDEFFLVDLGERIPAGQRIEVHTESLFVDEAGTFEPFVSAKVLPSLEHLELGVVTAAPARARYEMDDLAEDLTPTHQPSGAFRASKEVDNPQPGQHRISWSWE